MGAENEWTVWHYAGVGPPRVRIGVLGAGSPEMGKVLRKTGVAGTGSDLKGLWSRKPGAKCLGHRRERCLMMGWGGSGLCEERVCLRE